MGWYWACVFYQYNLDAVVVRRAAKLQHKQPQLLDQVSKKLIDVMDDRPGETENIGFSKVKGVSLMPFLVVSWQFVTSETSACFKTFSKSGLESVARYHLSSFASNVFFLLPLKIRYAQLWWGKHLKLWIRRCEAHEVSQPPRTAQRVRRVGCRGGAPCCHHNCQDILKINCDNDRTWITGMQWYLAWTLERRL